ncbi:MAG: hypothetical protein PVF17_10190 [Ignavibacteria bacterium]|jgi:hypothetical protein
MNLTEKNDDELNRLYMHIEKSLDMILKSYKKSFKLKKSYTDIAKEFKSLYTNEEELFSNGIALGELDKWFDTKALKFPNHLPFHTKIGLGHHAGHANIEEEYLLRDAFYSFLKAKESDEILTKFGKDIIKEHKEGRMNEKAYWELTQFKYCLITYARLSVVSFYSFLEAFVNSIGYDYHYKNYNILDDKEREILLGKSNSRYLSLEAKLEKYPTLIRKDKKQCIFLADKSKRIETYLSFFNYYKFLRDASIHYSPFKEPITMRTVNWIERAERCSAISIEVAKEFWSFCYPNTVGPAYLQNLEYDKQMEIATERIKIENELKKKYKK